MPAPGLMLNDVCVAFPGGFRLGPLRLAWQPGMTYGIVGKNGAGKSTFFETISGNLDYEGELSWGGMKIHPEAAEGKRRIGYLPQRHELPDWTTAREVISYVRSLRGEDPGPSAVAAAMMVWGCDRFADKPLLSLSHGMRKRVSLTLATMHNPDLLILDEPFSGLDLTYIHRLQECMRDRKARGLTTVFSTHIIPFLSGLSDEIHFVKAGRLEAFGAWSGLSNDAISARVAGLLADEPEER